MGTTFGIYPLKYSFPVGCICQQKLFNMYLPCLGFPFPLLKHFSGTFLVLPESSLHFFVFSPSTKMWETNEGIPSESFDQSGEGQHNETKKVFWTFWPKQHLIALTNNTKAVWWRPTQESWRELQRGKTTQSDNCDKDKPNQDKITKETLERRFVIVSSYFKQRTLCFELMCL